MKTSLCGILLLASLLQQAIAADPDTAIRTTFVPAYIAALRSRDTTRIRKFLHPQVLACMNENTKEYFDSLSRNEAGTDVTGNYVIYGLTKMTEPGPLFGLPEDGFRYPLQPAYEVHIQFKEGRLELVRFLAESEGSWLEVYPCPNEKGMAFMHEQMVQGEQQRQRVAQLVAELKDPLLSELKALVKQQRIIDAVKRYQVVSGITDLTTARMVIGVLESQ